MSGNVELYNQGRNTSLGKTLAATDPVDAGNTDWMTHPGKACNGEDTEIFYLTTQPEDIKAAKLICDQCPVRAACLAWAFKVEDTHAILGGTTPRERHLMKRRAGRASAVRAKVTLGQARRNTEQERRNGILDDWVELSAEGLNVPEAAARMGLTATALEMILRKAKKVGDERAVYSYVGLSAARFNQPGAAPRKPRPSGWRRYHAKNKAARA